LVPGSLTMYLSRAAGIGAGRDREAAAKGEFALAAPDGMLVEDRYRLIPMLRPEVPHALPFEPETTLGPNHGIVFFIERFLLLRPSPRATSP
jgi:hypothetical protein